MEEKDIGNRDAAIASINYYPERIEINQFPVRAILLDSPGPFVSHSLLVHVRYNVKRIDYRLARCSVYIIIASMLFN